MRNRQPVRLLAVVLGVADVRTPLRRALGNGQMRHEIAGTRTVPVLLAVRGEDDVARIDLDDLLTPGLDPAAPLGDVEGLAAGVGVPGGSGAGGEVHGGRVELR